MALPEELKALAAEVSNWGRWGEDDQRGTANLLTPAAACRGAAAVRSGKRFELGIPMGHAGPQTGGIPGRFNPIHAFVGIDQTYTGSSDDFTDSNDILILSTQGTTHWDAIAHVTYEEKLFNGFPASKVSAHRGATRCGIDRVGPVVTRGVLLDVAAAKGVGRLDGGYPITGDDLDAAAAMAAVTVEPGDAVLVHTGQMQVLDAARTIAERDEYRVSSPGIGTGAIRWIREHDVAAMATDNLTFEVFPFEDPKVMLPVHMITLRDIGLLQGQNWRLGELAADCASDGQYDFLLEATPEPIVGGTGSPVNPVAVK
ncbi:MAG: cyclase family protein [Acidimicrobiia bacterium]|nr:cyclase family protein [Acidimicrobiia bacterium]